MDRELKKRLTESFRAPEPAGKQEFINKLRPRRIGTLQMLLQQIPYIRPHVWLFSALIVAVAVAGSALGRQETAKIVSLIMPFTAALGIVENGRSQRYNMSELETATRFSLRSVIFARMTIIGFLAMIVTAIATPVIANSFDASAVVTAEMILIPYLITMIVSLHVERSPLGRENGMASVVVAGAVMTLFLLIWQSEKGIALYSSFLAGGFGIAAVLALFALALTEQSITVRKVEAFA